MCVTGYHSDAATLTTEGDLYDETKTSRLCTSHLTWHRCTEADNDDESQRQSVESKQIGDILCHSEFITILSPQSKRKEARSHFVF